MYNLFLDFILFPSTAPTQGILKEDVVILGVRPQCDSMLSTAVQERDSRGPTSMEVRLDSRSVSFKSHFEEDDNVGR